MLKVEQIYICNCGAITIRIEGGISNSMSGSTFQSVKGKLDMSNASSSKVWCCDHCVNHYGIDLCECGSGEMVGKCSCGSMTPYQTLGVEIDHMGLIIRNFGK